MSKDAPRIFLSAGEPSGDLHGAAVARALKQRWPKAELIGLGGDLMAAAGVQLQAHTRDLAVMGFVEVLKHLPFFAGLWSDVKHSIRAKRPDLIIPIDYPGFNLRLAEFGKSERIPVLYFIAPQVWAWHKSRMKQMAHNVDRLAVVLPFEESLFREAGAKAHFVGHPLLDLNPDIVERSAFAASLGISPDQPILALFPGSRAQEVSRHFPLFMEIVKEVRRTRPTVQPVVAAAAGVSGALFKRAGYPFTTDTGSLLAHARAALVKSGTTTLQTALALVPMVVTYQMHPITYQLARNLVEVPHIALANLVAGERVVPELIQDEAKPQRVAEQLIQFLDDTPERTRVIEGLRKVRERLGRSDQGTTAAERVVSLAAELIEKAA